MLTKLLADPEKYPNVPAALIHPSFRSSTANDRLQFQRLEILGDAVLDLVTLEILLSKYPTATEGELSVRRSRLVEEKALVPWAKSVEFDSKLSVSSASGSANRRMIADAVEALIGAVYLDSGLKKSRRLISEIIGDKEDEGDAKPLEDWNAKGDLQSFIQKRNANVSVEYLTTGQEGPDHDPVFTIHACIGGRKFGEGKARSKKEAEKVAAKQALVFFQMEENLDVLNEVCPYESRKKVKLNSDHRDDEGEEFHSPISSKNHSHSTEYATDLKEVSLDTSSTKETSSSSSGSKKRKDSVS